MPCYPRWASYGVPTELLAGKSKWMSEPHSIGVGLWPNRHISRYPRAVTVGVGTIRYVPRAQCLSRWDSTHATPAWVSNMTCRDASSHCWAWTVASLGLVLGHRSLCHPKATVRTQLVGQSRNL
jgi:hypothetical protein